MNKPKPEYRTIQSKVTVREGESSEGLPGSPKLTGYAVVFNQPSEDMGGYVEIIAPGAFTETLKTNDVRAFYNHDFNFLLARSSSGTLRLFEDDYGLGFEIDLADTTLGKDLYQMVKRGDLDGVSFGFYSLDDEWSEDRKVNTVLQADLIEISPVVYPAYAQPKVEARSLDRLKAREKRQQRVKKLLAWYAELDAEEEM